MFKTCYCNYLQQPENLALPEKEIASSVGALSIMPFMLLAFSIAACIWGAMLRAANFATFGALFPKAGFILLTAILLLIFMGGTLAFL